MFYSRVMVCFIYLHWRKETSVLWQPSSRRKAKNQVHFVHHGQIFSVSGSLSRADPTEIESTKIIPGWGLPAIPGWWMEYYQDSRSVSWGRAPFQGFAGKRIKKIGEQKLLNNQPSIIFKSTVTDRDAFPFPHTPFILHPVNNPHLMFEPVVVLAFESIIWGRHYSQSKDFRGWGENVTHTFTVRMLFLITWGRATHAVQSRYSFDLQL